MQKINIKKYTKEQMLKMLEEAAEKQEAAENCCCDKDCERSCCDEETAADEPAVPKLPTVRLFISQPMRGRSDEEIERGRAKLIKIAEADALGAARSKSSTAFSRAGSMFRPAQKRRFTIWASHSSCWRRRMWRSSPRVGRRRAAAASSTSAQYSTELELSCRNGM